MVACMDARLNPYGILGLSEGDAHVIRNAGGVVTDEEIRSLAISQHMLGTEEIMLIHHTDCGMLTYTEDRFPGEARIRDGRPARLDDAFVHRPRGGPAQAGGAHPGEPLHPAQERARFRLRGREREAARGHLKSSASTVGVE